MAHGENHHDVLSKRELEVIKLMAEGLTHKQVAERLYISPGTVRKHLENIYQKLNVKNRIEAIIKLNK